MTNAAAPSRRPNGTLLPGLSGNPSGRPKIVGEVQALARKHAPAAFARVVALTESEDERVALSAAQEVLNRAWGKPVMQVQSDVRKLDIGPLWLEAMKQASALQSSDGAKLIESCETTETSYEDGAADGSDETGLEGATAAPSVDW